MNRISVRQICIVLSVYNAVSKLIVFPTFLANGCGNALLFPALFNMVLQTIIIWSLGYLSSKTDKTFFELLENTFGKITAKVIFALFALYFFACTLFPMTEQMLFGREIFYDTIPSLTAFLPFFFFSVYAGSKKFKNAGRCADICLPLFVAAIICLMIMSVGEGRYDMLLPILKQPFTQVAKTSLFSIFRFTESGLLLMFLGHFKYKKGDCAKMTVSYAVGGLIVLAVMAVFYAIYGELAQAQAFALSHISIFFSAISLIGRIDFIALYALDLVTLFALILNVQMCCYCLSKTFKWDNRAAWSLIVNALLFVCILFINNNYLPLFAFGERWMWIPVVIFADIIPLCAWALRRKR